MSTETVRFRSVKPGTPIPPSLRSLSPWQTAAAGHLRYLCPDLTEEEAAQIAPRLVGAPRNSTATYRRAIERDLPAMRGVDQVTLLPWDGLTK